jgi:hypothetical protein
VRICLLGQWQLVSRYVCKRILQVCNLASVSEKDLEIQLRRGTSNKAVHWNLVMHSRLNSRIYNALLGLDLGCGNRTTGNEYDSEGREIFEIIDWLVNIRTGSFVGAYDMPHCRLCSNRPALPVPKRACWRRIRRYPRRINP